MTATSENPEAVEWRFRSHYNSNGKEKWNSSIKWLNQPENKSERPFETEDYAGKGGMVGRY